MSRLPPDDRKQQILQAAYQLACAEGFLFLTRETVARAADVAPALVNRYFFTMIELRRAVMELAVERRQLWLIAQGLVLGEATACGIPDTLKREALGSMMP